jgi:hypothetical protein
VGPGNIIAYNAFTGIVSQENDKDRNTYTRNSIYQNGSLGVDLYPPGVNPNDPGDVDTGPNEQLNHAVLNAATTTTVTGTACAGCTVELFIADIRASDSGQGQYGQGRTFIGSAVADGAGNFSAAVSGLVGGEHVTALVIDSDGNTSEFARNIHVIGGSGGGQSYVNDDYERALTDSWGSAPTGGAYSYYPAESSPNFDVAGGAGLVAIPSANQASEAILQTVNATDVNVTFRFQTDKTSWGDSQEASFIARWLDSGTMYRLTMRIDDNGPAIVQAWKGVAGSWSSFGSMVIVSNVSTLPNTWVNVRAQVVGINPTTLRLKMWNDGQTEPSIWSLYLTDNAPALQSAGAVGLRAFVGPSGTNAPITFRFDDFRVTSP